MAMARLTCGDKDSQAIQSFLSNFKVQSKVIGM